MPTRNVRASTRWLSVLLFAAAAVLALAAGSASAESTGPDAGSGAGQPDVFDWAFRFASAIETDPKDRAQGQQWTVASLIETGRLAEAEGLVTRIDSWRRGVAAAELGAAALREGQGALANRMIEVAQRAAAGYPEWTLRIQSHLAKAHALRGEQERSQELGKRLAADQTGQFAGQGPYSVALAQAVEGRIDEALATLETMKDVKDLFGAHRRTEGYLDIAALESLPRPMKLKVLEQGVESARGVPGLLKTRTLSEAAEAFAELGETERAVEVLQEVQGIALEVPDGADPKPPVLCNLARSWAAVGKMDRARRVLEQVDAAIAHDRILESDRPSFLANQAGAYAVVGDDDDAARLYNAALDHAEKLVNARPRALAIVKICTFMGRYGFTPDDQIAKRLESLFAGLGAPW